MFNDCAYAFDALYVEFVRAASYSYFEIVVLVSLVVGAPLLVSALKFKLLKGETKKKDECAK